MEKRWIAILNPEDEEVGHVHVDTDDIGHVIGEVYDGQARKLGAVRYEPLAYERAEGRIFNPDGDQIGHIKFEKYAEGKEGGEVYLLENPSEEAEPVLHVHYEPDSNQKAEVHKRAQWGELLGHLEAKNVSDQELILLGGGAALLAYSS